MPHEIVFGEMLVKVCVLTSFVGHDMGTGLHIRLDDRHQVGRLGPVHMEGTGAATVRAAFDQGHDRVLVGVAALDGHAFFLADENFVNLDLDTIATERREGPSLHRFPDAVRHEPRRFVLAVQDAHKLMAADTLLAAAHQINGLQPLVQRNMAGLEHRPDFHGELALAGAAAIQAEPTTFDGGNASLPLATRA